MKKLLAIAVSSVLILTGCASEPEFGEVSSAIQDSQDMQAEKTQSPEPEPLPTFELSALSVDPNLCKFEDKSPDMENWKPWMDFNYFPNLQTDPYRLKSVGELNLALVFVDWLDMAGTDDDVAYYTEQSQIMSDWFQLVSQGKLELNWRISDDWSTMDDSWRNHSASELAEESLQEDPDFMRAIVDLATEASDASFDYTDIDYVILAIPRSGELYKNGQPKGDVVLNSGIHGFAADVHTGYDRGIVLNSDERAIGNWAMAGTAFQDTFDHSPAWVFWAHEMGHMFGYVSHQPEPGVDDWGGGSMRHINPLMATGLFAHQWVSVRAVNGWTSWVAGWLDDEQVRCVDAAEIDNEVFAVNNSRNPDGTTKALIIRTGETTGLVIESREWDPDIDEPTSMAEKGYYDGVVMYYIDSSRTISDGSLLPLVPPGAFGEVRDFDKWPGPAISFFDAWFKEGDTANYADFEIEVLSMQDGVDYVQVTRVTN